MWKILFWPITKSYEFLRGAAMKGAGAAASSKAAAAGATGAAKTSANLLAQNAMKAKFDKVAGTALLGVTGGLATLGGIMGFTAVVKTDETAAKVGDFIGGTAEDGKNVILGLLMLAGITAIGVGAFVLLRRK